MRVWVAASPCSDGLPDPIQRDVSSADHDVIGKANDRIALSTQPIVPGGIVLLLFFVVMRWSVELDDQAILNTKEIGDVVPNRSLASEFGAAEPSVPRSR